MVENGYYDEEVFERYTAEFIDGLDERLRKAGFRFRTFMSAYKFYAQYAMKTNDQKSGSKILRQGFWHVR